MSEPGGQERQHYSLTFAILALGGGTYAAAACGLAVLASLLVPKPQRPGAPGTPAPSEREPVAA